MKSYNNLFEKISSFENLCNAFYKSRKGKSNSPDAVRFFFNLEHDVFSLKEKIESGNYSTGKYKAFTVFEPKKRLIKAVPFKDRVVHHAICNLIEPIFDSGFIDYSYACRKNKGTHKALKKIKNIVQGKKLSDTCYALKCDIKKYFPSIDHSVLKYIIRKRISDKKLVKILDIIIDSDSSIYGKGKGIPIGNLTSQLFANIYLNSLDQFVKHNLKCRYYLRYVDDFIIFSESKKMLHIYKQKIKQFLKKELCLDIHQKKANIFLVSSGVDFVGYQVYPEVTRIRKSNINKFRKRMKHLLNLYKSGMIEHSFIESSIQSWLGHAKHADAYLISRIVLKKCFENSCLKLRNKIQHKNQEVLDLKKRKFYILISY